jgi:hypothetical protein
VGSRVFRSAALVIWIGMIVGLFAAGMRYERMAGDAPARWPVELPIARTPGHVTILLAAHPQCPCSRATATLLEQLQATPPASTSASTDFVVLMFSDRRKSATWAHTDLWTQLQALPRTRVLADPDGRLAVRLGARMSGHVLAYDATGALQFSGGLTAARGTAIASPGFHAVRAILAGHLPPVRDAAVFGCSLITVTVTDTVGSPARS